MNSLKSKLLFLGLHSIGNFMEDYKIHLVMNGSQGDIQILCTEHWTETGWRKDGIIRKDLGLGGGIYRAEDDSVYTFADAVATCPECIEKRKKQLNELREQKIKKLKQSVA